MAAHADAATIQIDVSRLSSPTVAFDGTAIVGAASYTVAPGHYALATTTNTFTVGTLRESVAFDVASDGTVAYDPGLEGILGGAGSTTLTAFGLSVVATSQLSAARLFLDFGNAGPEIVPGATTLHLLPGPYYASQVSILPTGNARFGIAFTLAADGSIAIDPGEATYLASPGPGQLQVAGLQITITSQLSSSRLFINYGNYGNLASTGTTTLRMLPGPYYAGQSSQLASTTATFGVTFTVNADGTIAFDGGESAYVSGQGTSTLAIAGFPIHVDSQLAAAQLFVNFGNFGPGILPGPTDLRLLPGPYYGSHGSAGTRNGVGFSVTTTGRVALDPAATGYTSASGASLVIAGFPISFDSHLTGAQLFFNYGNYGPVVAPGSRVLRVLPGPYDGSTPTNRLGAAGHVTFTVTSSGTLAFAGAEDTYLAGRGTTTLAIAGLPVELDFRQFPAASYSLWSFATLANTAVQQIEVLPGSYELLIASAAFAFDVTPAGAFSYAPALATQLSGAGTARLTYGDAACTSNADCSAGKVCNSGSCGTDSSAPTVSLTSVPAFVRDCSLVVSASVADNGAVVSAEIKLNGQSLGSVAPTLGFVAATVTLVPGANVIEIDATDAAGNVGTASTTVVLDTAAPAIAILAPAAGQALGAPDVTVVVQVDDASPTTLVIGAQRVDLPAGGGLVTVPVALAAASGTQTIAVTVTDLAGNASEAAATVLVDLAAPLVDPELADGTQLGALPGDVLALTIHVDDVGATQVVVSGAAPVALPRGGGVLQIAVPLAEGTDTIAIAVTNEGGHSSTTTRTVVYDRTAPVLAIASPSGGTTHGSVDVSVDATDALTGVASVTYALDGGPPIALAPTQPGVYGTTLSTLVLADGSHALAIRAVDGVGNVATAARTLVVDNTPPTVAILAPAADAYVHGSVIFTAVASDAGSGIASLALAVNGAPVVQCAASPCSVTVDTTALPNGAASFVATASDRADNAAPAAQVAVTVANETLAGFLTSPANGALVTTGLTVAVHIVDPYFASVECFVGGTSLGTSTDPSFHRSVSLLDQLDGALDVTCRARDLAGNTGTQIATVTVKNWTLVFHPHELRLKDDDKYVTMSVRGVNAGLLTPIAGRHLAITVPGGVAVPAIVGRVHGHDDDDDCDDRAPAHVDLKFDRRAFVASVSAGIANGQIDPRSTVLVTLVAGDHALGNDAIRVRK